MFSAFGKYSVKCVAMSSEGGRWPKKLRSFWPELRRSPEEVDRVAVVVVVRASEGDQSAPRPDMTLTVLARFILPRSPPVVLGSRLRRKLSSYADPRDDAEGDAGSTVVEGISIPR